MNRFKQILSFLSSCSGLFLFVAGCCNFFLAYRATSCIKSVVTTNVVEMVVLSTNELSSASSPSNSSPSVSSPFFFYPPSSPSSPSERVPRQVAEYPYQYFLCGRRIGACMFGRYYYDGSPCSYGRIDKIFPDRIILVGGDWIQNRFDSFVSSKSIPPPPLKIGDSNER